MTKNRFFKRIVNLILFINIFLTTYNVVAQEVLFSIPYGEEDAQVYMFIPDPDAEDQGEAYGPGFFFVDDEHDVVYLSLKKFKTNGVFISKMQPEENQSLEGIRTCSWVDSEENIYVVGRNPIYRCDQIAKLDKEGKIIWTKTLPEIVGNNKKYKSIWGGIKVDAQGNVYFEVDFKAKPEDELSEFKYLKLDKDGNPLGEVPSYYLDKNNNYYVFHSIESEGKLKYYFMDENYVGSYTSGADIEMFNPEKQFVKKVNISFPDEFKQFENYRGVDQWDIDSEGNIYVTAFVRRDPDKETELNGETFIIRNDLYIYKYNQRGEFISQIKIPDYPVDLSSKIRVDKNGDIYYLQFYADHLDVVKVSSDNIAPQTNISISPFPNILGWNKADVNISLTATDNEGGSGVKEIHYTLTGAVNEDKIVPGQTAQIVLKTEGTTTISYYTLDNAGNKDETKSLILNLDKTAPLVSLNLEPYKIKLPFRHETHHFYTPFFYKLTYSATDSLSGIKGSKTGLITPNINGFKTQLIKGKQ
ncbi:MAG: hypothetical protein PHH44_01820, partial [bacterium]|nr:hypothetical protein [bacterium]